MQPLRRRLRSIIANLCLNRVQRQMSRRTRKRPHAARTSRPSRARPAVQRKWFVRFLLLGNDKLIVPVAVLVLSGILIWAFTRSSDQTDSRRAVTQTATQYRLGPPYHAVLRGSGTESTSARGT